ncbi:unnamed protein product [Sphenostylis stenocarpa]|uniref:Uncharacterized protein n=1 Tax=Sphenostylis stenocarpa TaxID=92480 RepID=A0AA86VV36_9FABA|nr:unnamed protein product [Sphenostylis stenocarpa]
MSGSSHSRFVNRMLFGSPQPRSVLRALFGSPPKSVGVKVREITAAGSKVSKIVLEFSNLPKEESERRRKLLNSIDKIEEVVLEQLQILKNTARAKEVERENRKLGAEIVMDEYSQCGSARVLFLLVFWENLKPLYEL